MEIIRAPLLTLTFTTVMVLRRFWLGVKASCSAPSTWATCTHTLDLDLDRRPIIINVPLPRKCQPLLFQQKFEEHVVMAIERYQPDLLLVSAGFDGHAKETPQMR
jgi:hypothetical protein